MDIDYHRMVQQLAFVYIYLSLYKIILKLVIWQSFGLSNSPVTPYLLMGSQSNGG